MHYRHSNRWLIAIAAIIMQTMLGTAYAWSVFKNPLQQTNNWTSAQLSLAFTLMIFFLGLAAAFGGKFVDKQGVRRISSLAAVLFGCGTLIAGYATQTNNLPLLWLGYGVIAGIGNGLGYISPVAILVRWFPDRRGLITGLAVMGFGLGGAFIAIIAPALIGSYGIANTFYILGLVYLVAMLICAQAFKNPPTNWMADYQAQQKQQRVSMDLPQAARTPQFYILWVVFLVNITAGVALLSNLSPLSQQWFSLTAAQAGLLVFATSVFNGLGRVFWSTLSDRIGRKTTFMIIIYSQIPCLFLLPTITNVGIFAVISCYLVSCMGGGFATMPAFVADTFGAKHLGNIYGKYLLAWSTAGAIGPLMMEMAFGLSGNYQSVFYILAVVFLCVYIPLTHYLKPTELAFTSPA